MKSIQKHIKTQQWSELEQLLQAAAHTEYGKKYKFGHISTYQQFESQVPVHSYPQISDEIQRLKDGDQDIFWPGSVRQFAVSAGTSGEGKHLPLTPDRMQSDRHFMREVIKSYLKQRPNILRLAGSHLSMPGSVEQQGQLKIGEISGFTALHAPGWLKFFQVAEPGNLTKLSFREKFELLLENAIDADVRVITAVPSWILTLFQQVLKKTGSSSIAEVWPNLKLIVCGGVKLANYKPHLEQLTEGIQPDFIETYGASEGYIGYSDDLNKSDLKMVTNNGIFFECIPNPLPNTDASAIQETLPLWEVETGVPYALLMTTNAGLWRYTLNDVIEFTSLNPLRFVVKGRVNDMLDEFGEALYIYEAEKALKEVTESMDREMGNFTIAPIMQGKDQIPYHRWFVQFLEPIHTETLQKMALKIDQKIRDMNRHYAIRRESEALGMPQIKSITQADINEWMRAHGKDNAQGKLPKIMPKNATSLSV